MNYGKDYTGLRVGNLTAIRYHGRDNNEKQLYLFQCDCGNEKVCRVADVKSGKTTSCGCYQKQRASASATKHGGSDTQLYRAWKSMRERCLNSQHVKYYRYGGRGITICSRWDNFNNFRADLGEPPSPDLSLHRINNDGNYEPQNCKWATDLEQAANRGGRFA